MRNRRFFIFAALLLPVVAGAQTRRRPPPVSRPPDPAPLPPQAPGIPDERLYQSSRFYGQTYPIIGMIQTDRYVTDAGAENYLTQGEGIRVEWRGTPSFAIGADYTMSFLGAPFMFHTLELGGRWRPQLNGWAQPYMDLRVAYGMSLDGYADPFFATAGSVPAAAAPSGRTNSGGLGAVAGAGFDVPLSEWVSLTGALSGSRYRMSN